MPDREDIAETLAKHAAANITQGYRIIPNKTKQLPFVFVAEINIKNDRLWDLFTAPAVELTNIQSSGSISRTLLYTNEQKVVNPVAIGYD